MEKRLMRDRTSRGPMPYAKGQRMRMIDFLLAQYGTINRAALMDFFGISMPQASDDFATYNQLAPRNMAYDASAKTWRRTDNFKRLYP
jgi:hypothetical protein